MTVRRTTTKVLPAIALAAAAALAPVAPAAAAPPQPGAVVSLFPTDELTVADPGQLTGRRVDLPFPDCTVYVTDCNTIALLNELDGFDLDPRLALRFDAPVDAAQVAARTTVTRVGGGPATGVERVVYDAMTYTVYAHPVDQLAPGTTYRLRVGGLRPAQTTFTTLSALDGLQDMRAQLDSGSAYDDAGIAPAQRGLTVDLSVPADGTTLLYLADQGTGTTVLPVINLSTAGAGRYVFGSFLAPSWLTPDVVIPQTPTGDDGPMVQGQARLPFVLILPAGPTPRGGWPVAIFGHGFTRTDADVFLAATRNAARGFATIATTVVGHGYGPDSSWQVLGPSGVRTAPAYGRGVDIDGNGFISEVDGAATLPQPAPFAQVNSRDVLRQTAADVMTLLRAIGRGVDLDGDGALDLARTGTDYYGQSFGGIYGTMFAGTDPRVDTAVLNVPGGPISEIARLSPSFRPLVTQQLAGAIPPLLNGGFYGFTESMPLAGQPPVLDPAPGALPIQEFLAEGTWLNRPGSPETFAPELPFISSLVQVARGDATVPNPTSDTLLDAANDLRSAVYRNDRTARADDDPHGFLLDPTFLIGFTGGQAQILEFFATDGSVVIDPDGLRGVWQLSS